MAYTREQIIEKVEKCLALAAGTTPEEAEVALLHAQKLMAKYHISMGELSGTPGEAKAEKVVELRCKGINLMRPWVRELAYVVAKNFKCRNYLQGRANYRDAVFVGYETDATVAMEVFKIAYAFAERKGENLAQRMNDKGLSSRGVKVDFCTGFVSGLRDAYQAQIDKQNELALMVVAPKEADEILDSITGIFSGGIRQRPTYGEGYHEGYKNGHDFANRDRLEEGSTN